MLSTNEIEYFLALEAHRSFTSAAQSLGISQPALTVAIGRLEKRLGLRLFLRAASGIELTSEGESLLPAVRRARDAVRSVEQSARHLADVRTGTLRVASRPTLAREPVARLVGDFHCDHRQVDIEIASMALGATGPSLIRAGLADLAITSDDDQIEGLEAEHLGELGLVAIVPDSATLSDQPTVDEILDLGLLSMTGFGVMSRAIAKTVSPQRVAESVVLQSDYHGLLVQLALKGRGALFVPARSGVELAHRGARVVVPQDQPTLLVVGTYLPDHLPPAARRFLDVAHDRFGDGDPT